MRVCTDEGPDKVGAADFEEGRIGRERPDALQDGWDEPCYRGLAGACSFFLRLSQGLRLS